MRTRPCGISPPGQPGRRRRPDADPVMSTVRAPLGASANGRPTTIAPGPGPRGKSLRANWLRAAVLGANDGLVSTSSLVLGVNAAGSGRPAVLIAAVAGLSAGALSMAAGEYVSVSSQSDAEAADIALERGKLIADPVGERRELADLYVQRGVERRLADPVADQLMRRDALQAHVRDELGLTAARQARPLQAAWVSALAFASGAILPVIAVLPSLGPTAVRVVGSTLLGLSVLGALGAWIGGAPIARATLRVMFWGSLAMATTTAVGALLGTS